MLDNAPYPTYPRVAAAAQTAVVVKALRQALDDLLRRRANNFTASSRQAREGDSMPETNDEQILDLLANLLWESEK